MLIKHRLHSRQIDREGLMKNSIVSESTAVQRRKNSKISKFTILMKLTTERASIIIFEIGIRFCGDRCCDGRKMFNLYNL